MSYFKYITKTLGDREVLDRDLNGSFFLVICHIMVHLITVHGI